MKLTNKETLNSVSDARYNMAVLDMQRRHFAEHEEVHNGSGRSEELPSDLARRQADERLQLRKDRDDLSIMQWTRHYGSASRSAASE